MRWSVVLFGSLLGLGCSSGVPVASVEGVVQLDAKPLAELEVQFIPDPTLGSQGPPASAYTDANGRYQILLEQGGVVVGKHRVCINDARVMMPGAGMDAESGEVVGKKAKSKQTRSRVPARYSDANRTPFAAIEIQPGSQIQNFDLLSQP